MIIIYIKRKTLHISLKLFSELYSGNLHIAEVGKFLENNGR